MKLSCPERALTGRSIRSYLSHREMSSRRDPFVYHIFMLEVKPKSVEADK
jgi:hypothetical protein